MPKFVIDEDMPRSTGKVLMEQGYEVKDIRDHHLRGADDKRIYRFAQDNQAVLITGDLGFSNILDFPIGEHFGIVVSRFPNETSTKELNRQLVERIKGLTEEDVKGNLVIIEPGRTRIRKRRP
jgi:predicted nuclease of predicted toxin-antitoxin system